MFGQLLPETCLQDRHSIWWLFLFWSGISAVSLLYFEYIDDGMVCCHLMIHRVDTFISSRLFDGMVFYVLSLPYYDNTRYSVEMRNIYDISFQFPTIFRFYMFAILPVMYILIKRMYE